MCSYIRPALTALSFVVGLLANAQLTKPLDHKGEPPSASIAYMPQQGQFADVNGDVIEDLLYAAYGHGVKLYVRENCTFSYVGTQHVPDTIGPDTTLRLDVQLVGEMVNYDPVVEHDEETEWYHNYYLAHCAQGITGAHGYKVVALYGVYPGIDMYLYSNPWGYKIYFQVQPGFDPTNLALKFEGQDDLQIDYLGALEAVFGNRDLRIPQAIAYQEINGTTVPVAGWPEYDVNNNTGVVTFGFDPYDTDYPLIIDISESLGAAGGGGGQAPEWGTYYGGGEYERVNGMTAMNVGGIATCGETASPLFPVTAGIFSSNSQTDGYASYFNVNYERVLTTFLGGNGPDWCTAIADHLGGEVALAGQTFSTPATFPLVQPGAAYYDDTKGFGDRTAFVAVMDSLGALYWSTLFGPDNSLDPSAISVDAVDKSIVVGGTAEWDFPSGQAYPIDFTNGPTNNALPITGGGYSQSEFGRKTWLPLITNPTFWYDGWLARFEDYELTWSTLFGGSGYWDYIEDISIEPNTGEIVVVGHTLSPASINVPQCEPPPTDTIGFPWCQLAGGYWQDPIAAGVHYEGDMMAFIAQFDPQTYDLKWCTPFGALGGGSINTFANAVAHDATGGIYMVGFTYDVDGYSTIPGQPDVQALPASNTANPYQGANNNGSIGSDMEGYIAKFSLQSKALTWTSFLSLYPTDVTANYDYVSVAGDRYPVTPLQVSSDLYSDNNTGSPGNVCIMTFDEFGLEHSTAWGGDGNDLDALVARNLQDDRIYVAHNTTSIFDSPYHCPNVPPPAVPWCVDLNSGGQDVFYGQLLRQWPEVGIDDNGSSSTGSTLIVFPNPAEGEVSLTLPDRASTIEVFNGLGQLITRATPGYGATLQLCTATWAEGCYHVSALDGKGSALGRAKVFVVR